MNNGWVKLHRGLLDWEWYDDINTCRLFIHCLIRANHADRLWRGKEIKRGSFFTSLDTLALETGLTVRQVRTSLDRLISTNEVTSLGQARGRMIVISKYDSYQADDRLSDSVATGSRQADDRLPTTNKNVKNNKNDKKETIRFAEPSLPEVQNYFLDKTKDREQSGIEGMKFHAYYESNGWKVGKNKMKSWQSAATGWIARNITQGNSNEINGRPTTDRPDNSTTGRTRANAEKRRREIDAQIAEIARDGGLMAANVIDV